MRFPKRFSRWKGGSQPANIPILLGGDSVPASGNNAIVPTTAVPLDNMLSHRFGSINGWPCHRIAVIYNYKGVGSPVALNASIYIFEAGSQRWYRLGAVGSGNLTDGVVTFFDTIGLVEQASTGPTPDVSTGSEQALLIVGDPGTAPNGEHEFGMAPDLTTIGY